MRLVTPMADMATGRDRYGVWEYDETRLRNPTAADSRSKFRVKRFVGSFATLAEAKRAAE